MTRSTLALFIGNRLVIPAVTAAKPRAYFPPGWRIRQGGEFEFSYLSTEPSLRYFLRPRKWRAAGSLTCNQKGEIHVPSNVHCSYEGTINGTR
jgi:hypothetical protein